MKAIKQLFGIAIASIAIVGSVHAEIPTLGGTCVLPTDKVVTLEAVWNCDHLGAVTVKQIYEKGFRVVATINKVGGSSQQPTTLIIEKPTK